MGDALDELAKITRPTPICRAPEPEAQEGPQPIIVYVQQAPPPPKSFTGWAILTLILYWVGFWVIGLIANVAFLSSAKDEWHRTRRKPDGYDLLVAFLWLFFWIPLILGGLVLFVVLGYLVVSARSGG